MKVNDIQEFLSGVTASCNSDSSFQFFGSNDSSDYAKVQMDPSNKSNLFTSANYTLFPVSDELETFSILQRRMEELIDCSSKEPLGDKEAGILFIFTDISCTPSLSNGDFKKVQKSLLTRLFNQGFLVRFVYISNDGNDLSCYLEQLSECAHTHPICDISLYGEGNKSISDSAKDMQTCAPRENLQQRGDISTLDIVLLVSLPVLFISCVSFCCVWSFYRNIVRQAILQTVLNRHLKQTQEKENIKEDADPNDYCAQMNDVWQIDSHDLEIMDSQVLGKGAFAKVVKGRLKGNIPLLVVNSAVNLLLENTKGGVCEVAVKRLPPHADRQSIVDFLQEIDFMKKLGYHSHIISMVGCVVCPTDPLILLEFCFHGDLLHFLQKNRPHIITSDDEDCPVEAEFCLRICDLISFAWQISDGVSYLHSKGYIHRDIAARNILITKNMAAKVSDFGLCRYADSALYVAKGGRLPVKWMAPESLKRFEFSEKSDAWSFGILLHELFSLGDTPYPTVQPIEMIKFLEEGNRMDQPAICPDETYALMKACWEEEVSIRPSLDDLCSSLRNMLNAEDEYFGYVKLENPKSVRYMLNREVSEFPSIGSNTRRASTQSALLDAITFHEDIDLHGRRPSLSDTEDFYSTKSRFSTMKTAKTTNTRANFPCLEEVSFEEDDWSVTTATGAPPTPELGFSEVISTCHKYPTNHERTAIEMEMADFFR